MTNEINDLTPLGYYNFRHQQKKFGIKIDDRRRHIYIIGKTGVGKTTLLENMAIADIRSGKGVAIVDPHGEFAEKILDFVPEERLDDVIYFDPSDMEYPIAFNPMEQVGTEYRHLVASGLMGVFKKIWADAWSARMQYILNNTLLALLENPGATLLGILRMFSNPNYRKQIVDNLRDPVIKAFWQDEFSKYSQRFETEALAAIQNKVGQFVSNPLVRNILGQPHSSLNMREIMDTGKIFICNLSKGKIGEDNSALLGAMIITRLQLAAMSRVDLPEEKRRDFFLYVDEFQNFATESFANILSEARKYRLSLVLAHQYIGQLRTGDSTMVRDAVFGNVGTIIAFRVGAEDAEFLEKEFMPEFLQNDLVNLSKANVYIKLMIDGVASRPFSAETMPPQKIPLGSYRDVILKNSRDHYGTPKAAVEARIASEWHSGADSPTGSAAPRAAEPRERRLSEVLVSNQRPRMAPGMRDVRDAAPRAGTVPPRREPMPTQMTVAIREEKDITSKEPEDAAPRASAPEAPKRVLHPDVDINALKRAITQSLGTRPQNSSSTPRDIQKPISETGPERSESAPLASGPQKENVSIAHRPMSDPRESEKNGPTPVVRVIHLSDLNKTPPEKTQFPKRAEPAAGPKIDVAALRQAIGEVKKKQDEDR